MALEAVVCPQDLLTHACKHLHSMAGGPWIYELADLEEAGINGLLASECQVAGGGLASRHGSAATIQEPWWGAFDGGRGPWDPSCPSSPEAGAAKDGTASPSGGAPLLAPARCRRKRRRTKTCKNEEEVQNQRMTHIAVERNRRKQMNEYLAALRSLMPAFYVQRGDQASIVGGAINFVKQLEQLLQSLEAQKRMKQQQQHLDASGCGGFLADAAADHDRASLPEVEVTMVDSHANLKVLSRRRPQQLLRMVTGLQGLRLTTLHLNVTTVDQIVRYSLSLKVEDDSLLSSVEEIATAVHQLLEKIQEETGSNF
ncbi:hypothetical protein Taro_029261 [Colocasia esculenta]|uniref:BHLH domain-containing protein n=1 Tax=Colocasia esculenta TaxID=4460 RepID=A0A843VIJ0_COLES|nr:hypothetical protein [Colocasia esculenta]